MDMYAATVPVFDRMLASMQTWLRTARDHAIAKGFDESVYLTMRLAPDMLPLSRQIQIATDGAKGCAARLAGVDVPSYADTETTIDELKARIDKTIAFLQTFTPAQIDGTENKTVTLKLRGEDTQFQGQPYLLNFVLPNLYFHVTTAYAILRHNGVEVGKRDYLGSY